MAVGAALLMNGFVLLPKDYHGPLRPAPATPRTRDQAAMNLTVTNVDAPG